MLKSDYFKKAYRFLLTAILFLSPHYLFAKSLDMNSLDLEEFVQEEITSYRDGSDSYSFAKNFTLSTDSLTFAKKEFATNLFLQESLEQEKVLLLQSRLPQFEASITKLPCKDSPSGKGVTRFSKDLVLSQSRDSRFYFLLPTIARESYQHSFIHFHTVQLFFWQEFVQAKFQRYLALLTNSPPFCNRIRH
ncbi:MAG: hypothetical protein AAF518_25505, partial [Spirochaetota bacterium]